MFFFAAEPIITLTVVLFSVSVTRLAIYCTVYSNDNSIRYFVVKAELF
jgi:hypothetical protein